MKVIDLYRNMVRLEAPNCSQIADYTFIFKSKMSKLLLCMQDSVIYPLMIAKFTITSNLAIIFLHTEANVYLCQNWWDETPVPICRHEPYTDLPCTFRGWFCSEHMALSKL